MISAILGAITALGPFLFEWLKAKIQRRQMDNEQKEKFYLAIDQLLAQKSFPAKVRDNWKKMRSRSRQETSREN